MKTRTPKVFNAFGIEVRISGERELIDVWWNKMIEHFAYSNHRQRHVIFTNDIKPKTTIPDNA